MPIIKMHPKTNDAYRLFHEGVQMFARMEANGIPVDMGYVDREIASVKKEANEKEKKLRSTKFYGNWQKKFGLKTNLGSKEQLGKILFKDMNYPVTQYTDKSKFLEKPFRKASTSEEHLKKVPLKFVGEYIDWSRLTNKVLKILEAIKRETINGRLHPFFDLHLVKSFRGSSHDPNFQNFPIRNKKMGQLIRSAFIPPPGWQFYELDFNILEVRIATCYHKDPRMIKYVTGGGDMHLDQAMEIYCLKDFQVSKESRYCAKNKYVFPQFYGSYYVDCAIALWNAIHNMELKVKRKEDGKECTGRGLQEHLARFGITELGACDPDKDPVPGTFEYHIKEVEQRFWNEKFPVYRDWKKAKYKRYLEKGSFQSLTGFTYQGIYRRNQVINLDVQGSAFHCCLQACILIEKELWRCKMKTRICGTIHDSILAYGPPGEREGFLELASGIMTREIARMWPWIIVPLTVEAEVAPIGASWFHKEKVAC